MIVDALHLVAGANLAGSAAIGAVILLRGPVRSAFGASAAYRLWAIPPIMALAALVPAPTGGPVAPIVLAAASRLPTVAAFASGSLWPAALAGAWGLGVILCAAVFGTRQFRFASALGGGSAAEVG